MSASPPAKSIEAVLEWLEPKIRLGPFPPTNANGDADGCAVTYAAGRASVLDELRAELRRQREAS